MLDHAEFNIATLVTICFLYFSIMLDYAEFNIATLVTICYLYFSIMLDYAEFNIATLVTIFYLYFTIFFYRIWDTKSNKAVTTINTKVFSK